MNHRGTEDTERKPKGREEEKGALHSSRPELFSCSYSNHGAADNPVQTRQLHDQAFDSVLEQVDVEIDKQANPCLAEAKVGHELGFVDRR